MPTDTKQRLLNGAIEAIRQHGIAGVSARTIAAAAGVNQALVFYHFGSVDQLLADACTTNAAEHVGRYAERFEAVGSLRELLELGRQIHLEERGEGNVAVLGQLLAGAQTDPKLAPGVAASLQLWVDAIEPVLARLLTGTPFAEVADIPGLARAVSAAFIGLELFEAVDEAGARQALDALDQLAVLVEVVDDLGPVARRALRSRVRRASSRRGRSE
jgi:AcrR family transcriptional regulator